MIHHGQHILAWNTAADVEIDLFNEINRYIFVGTVAVLVRDLSVVWDGDVLFSDVEMLGILDTIYVCLFLLLATNIIGKFFRMLVCMRGDLRKEHSRDMRA